MNNIQLEFEIYDDKFYVTNICNKCIKECKIYCISNAANVYCNKYKED